MQSLSFSPLNYFPNANAAVNFNPLISSEQSWSLFRKCRNGQEGGSVFGLGVSERVSARVIKSPTPSSRSPQRAVPPISRRARAWMSARAKLGARGPRRRTARALRPSTQRRPQRTYAAGAVEQVPAGRRRRRPSDVRREPSISVCQTAGVRTSERAIKWLAVSRLVSETLKSSKRVRRVSYCMRDIPARNSIVSSRTCAHTIAVEIQFSAPEGPKDPLEG